MHAFQEFRHFRNKKRYSMDEDEGAGSTAQTRTPDCFSIGQGKPPSPSSITVASNIPVQTMIYRTADLMSLPYNPGFSCPGRRPRRAR